jgi:hypothetical protein
MAYARAHGDSPQNGHAFLLKEQTLFFQAFFVFSFLKKPGTLFPFLRISAFLWNRG